MLSDYVIQHGHHKYDRYFPFYDATLGPFSEKSLSLLEIGCSADSLTMWRDVFPLWEIYGLDRSSGGPTNQDDLHAIEGVTFVEGDQTDPVVLSKFPALDVVVDDAGHRPLNQITTFEFFFPRMHEGGWYFIEDLHTSYWEGYGEGNVVDYSKGLLDDLNAVWREETPDFPVAEVRMIDSLLAVRRA